MLNRLEIDQLNISEKLSFLLKKKSDFFLKIQDSEIYDNLYIKGSLAELHLEAFWRQGRPDPESVDIDSGGCRGPDVCV